MATHMIKLMENENRNENKDRNKDKRYFKLIIKISFTANAGKGNK